MRNWQIARRKDEGVVGNVDGGDHGRQTDRGRQRKTFINAPPFPAIPGLKVTTTLLPFKPSRRWGSTKLLFAQLRVADVEHVEKGWLYAPKKYCEIG